MAVTKKYGTYRSYYQSIYTYILPRIGHMRLDKIRKTHIQEMANDIFRDGRERSKDGKATVRKAVAALRKALGDAIKQDLLPSELKNPASDVEVPSEQNRDINIWTPYQTKRLLAVARHTRHFAILYTALTSGMREGELCGLKWSDLEPIDVPLNGERRRLLVINIRRELVVVPKRHQGVANLKLTHVHGQYFFDTPKTKKSLSKVLVAEDTLEVLEKHRVEQEEAKRELAGRYHDYDLVFPATTGVPQSPRNLLRDYKKILHKARIPELNFHDLRDSHSSLLQGLGKELAVVSERLRHSRKSTTADRYTHALSSSRLEGAVTMRELLKLGRSDR